MTSRRTNSNTSATVNPRLAYPPPPPASNHDNPYEYYFPSPPPPSLSSPLNQLTPFDYFFSIDEDDDVNDHWHFENPVRPLPNTIQVTRVTRTRRPLERAIGEAQLPAFSGSLAPPGSRIRAILLNDPRTRQILSGTQWTLAAPREQEADSRLTHNEQKRALQKMRKLIYNPLRRISPTVNLYYRGTIVQDGDKERNDNGKSCAICLEDFEPKQEVMLTPCNHMFHEDCIVPWVKSNGRCPVCRFGISD